jgi:DNA repair exonuclease SbcCD ATPase subunit
MTINNTVPFMAQSKVDKRKFIESVLKLEVFSEMLLKARDEYNEFKKDYEVLFAKNEVIEKTYNNNKLQLDQFEENKKNRFEQTLRRIEDSNTKITTLLGQIVELPDNVNDLITSKLAALNDKLSDIQKRYREAFANVTVIKSNISQIEKQIKDLDQVEAVCRSCKRPFPENDIKHKEQHKNDLNQELDVYSSDMNTAATIANDLQRDERDKKSEITVVEAKKDKISTIKSNNISLQNKIDLLNENIIEFNNECTNITNESNATLEQTVTSLEQEVNNNKIGLRVLDHQLSVLECVKFVVSEEGVKSYIVKKILKLLNARLAYYLDCLQANCVCQFDEFFDEQITDEKGETKSYFNFSGGERKRIDLACLFAFLDIRRMQGDINFNTIFYDELLDSSLDDKGVELVMKVLRERLQKYNEGCYIITHRSNAINSKVDSVIHLEKRNGFTYILNND